MGYYKLKNCLFFSYIFRCIFIIPNFFVLSHQDFRPSLEAFSGVYTEEVPSSSQFYSTFFPIVYSFKVPSWNFSELSLPLTPATYPCPSPTRSAMHSYLCNLNSLLPQIRDQVVTTISNNPPLLRRLQAARVNPFSGKIPVSCHTIQPHFTDFLVSRESMKDYIQSLKACSPLSGKDDGLSIEYFKDIPTYSSAAIELPPQPDPADWYESLVRDTNQRIPLPTKNPISLALATTHLNTWTSNQLTTLFNFHLEERRWAKAVEDCDEGRLPLSVLTPELLEDTLQDVQEALGRNANGLQLVAPVSQMGIYLKGRSSKKGLTDCAFTEDDTFYVRLLVPLVEKDRSFSLVRLRPATFYETTSKKLCQVNVEGNTIMFDKRERLAYALDSDSSNGLIKVPRSPLEGKMDPCGTSLLNKDRKGIAETCKLECTDFHTNDGPSIVSKVENDKVLIWSSNQTIMCEIFRGNGTSFVITIQGQSEVLELTMPCNSTLKVKEKKWSFFTDCRNSTNFAARKIIPFHWLPKAVLLQDQRRRVDEYLSASLDEYNAGLKVFKLQTEGVGNANQKDSSAIVTLVAALALMQFFLITIVLFLFYNVRAAGIMQFSFTKGTIRQGSNLRYANMSSRNIHPSGEPDSL